MRCARIPHLLVLLVAATPWNSPAPAAASDGAVAKAVAKSVAVEIRAQSRGQYKSFYATRGFWPIWAASGRIGPEADALIDLITAADLDGLDADSYDVAGLRQAVARARSGDPAAIAGAELALSRSFARYASDLRRHQRVRMTWLDKDLKPVPLPVKTILRAASLRPSLRDYVVNMGWMSPQYLRLRVVLKRAENLGRPKDELARIRLNLDRARLLPGPWIRHIVVDAASARLFYYDGGKQQGMMKVVVGTAETPTPMLAGTVRYAILNPYWNVPDYLVQKKFAPKLAAGQSLKAMRFEALSDWSVAATRLDPATVDWRAVAEGSKLVRLRQLPGGNNAMGRVKFMFPNDDGIYLHDTPDKALLAKPDRHFSNGCIRLEDAPRLGKWLLGKPLGALPKKPEQVVALPVGVPVYLTYFTATPTEKGVGFLKDVYGRDR